MGTCQIQICLLQNLLLGLIFHHPLAVYLRWCWVVRLPPVSTNSRFAPLTFRHFIVHLSLHTTSYTCIYFFKWFYFRQFHEKWSYIPVISFENISSLLRNVAYNFENFCSLFYAVIAIVHKKNWLGSLCVIPAWFTVAHLHFTYL